MNCRSLCFSLCLCLYSIMVCGQKIVDVPDFESSNTYMLDVVRVELFDSVTIFTMQVSQVQDGEFGISSRTILRGTGGQEVYKLLRAEGIPLDEQIVVQGKEMISFRLYFEPLQEGEKRVDYVEGDKENDWVIRGILLDDRGEDDREGTCVISGEVIDRPSSHRLLIKSLDNDSGDEVQWFIPIRDGKFKFVCSPEEVKAYQLIFTDELAKGLYYNFLFFLEPGNIHVTLHASESAEKNNVSGGKYNDEYNRYCQLERDKFQMDRFVGLFNELSVAGLYYTPRAMALQEEMYAAGEDRQKSDSLFAIHKQLVKAGEWETGRTKAIMRERDSVMVKLQRWREDYIEKNPSVVTSYFLLSDLSKVLESQIFNFPDDVQFCFQQDGPRLKRAFEKIYKPMFPDHSYTRLIASVVESMRTIKIGGHYIDFSAPDLDGNSVILSQIIAGKIALIDLWASWCGGCRNTSKSMVPVYEKYKSRGFTIVGVAREDKVDDARNAIVQDGYTWLNLVEINDRQGIWAKYGVANAGGSTFLVDVTGKILAINPTAEEVTAILERELK